MTEMQAEALLTVLVWIACGIWLATALKVAAFIIAAAS